MLVLGHRWFWVIPGFGSSLDLGHPLIRVIGFGTSLDLGRHWIWFASLLGVPPQGFPSLGLPPCWAGFGPLGNDCSHCLHALSGSVFMLDWYLIQISSLAGLVPWIGRRLCLMLLLNWRSRWIGALAIW